MTEKEELYKDYNECMHRVYNFEEREYIDDKMWALSKFVKWLKKDERYMKAVCLDYQNPIDERENAWFTLNTLRYILVNIGKMNNYE